MLHYHGLGITLIAPPVSPHTEYGSSDVKVFQLTPVGLAKLANNTPVRELVEGEDLTVRLIEKFRPTPHEAEYLRSNGTILPSWQREGSYRRAMAEKQSKASRYEKKK